MFLPRRVYATDGQNDGEQKVFRDVDGEDDLESGDIRNDGVATAGDVEMTNVVEEAI